MSYNELLPAMNFLPDESSSFSARSSAAARPPLFTGKNRRKVGTITRTLILNNGSFAKSWLVSLPAFVAKIKCSICSSQCDSWDRPYWDVYCHPDFWN